MKQQVFNQVLQQRLTRRSLLGVGAAVGVGSALPLQALASSKGKGSGLAFAEVPQGRDQHLTVAQDHQFQILIRWGDPIFSDAPEFDPQQQTAAKQERQFGFNNDFVGFLPLPLGSNNSDHGLLAVNHEYASADMMFPDSPSETGLNLQQVDVDIAAHGLSVIEIKRVENHWQVVKGSPFSRRITPLTPMQHTGPAAGSQRMKTAISSDGVHTLGTYGNCAGGVTPWGTVLTGEENVDAMFAGDFSQAEERATLERFGMRVEPSKSWAKHYDRWDLSKSPNESLHVGWIVEIDPYDPNSVPKKRTSLGRCKHEGCNVFINKDGHVVAYTGDDAKFEYVYKFVSANKYEPNNRSANMDLLEEGTLYCARFEDDGTLQWLPMIYGQGPLTAKNGFQNQGDVSIDSRKAADLLGATPMDRPEDVEVNPVTGSVFVMLTKNDSREAGKTDGANPRANNRAGQIVELIAPEGDHTQSQFHWDMFLLAGERNDPSTNYHTKTSADGWLACPDNCAFDSEGNIWIATDGAEGFGVADGIWATAVAGPNRQLTKRFLRTPIGAELCGPFFTPDDETLFCSVQHPGNGSSFAQPNTRWPDFDEKLPPRSSVVAITRKGGGRVGS